MDQGRSQTEVPGKGTALKDKGSVEAPQPRCTVLQKLWLLPSEGAPAWLQTLAGLGGLPTAEP